VLADAARVLKPGAEWRIASDDPTYQGWVSEVLQAQTLFDWAPPATTRPAGWPPTRYEAKAIRAGRQPQYWSVIRRFSQTPVQHSL
jgi:tRNA (guanine-N7-)-methyltransferase